MKPRIRSLTLEPLEDRTLMSTCHVTRLSDTGTGHSRGAVGDLRYCINKVNTLPGPDVIDITVTGTINLSGPLPDLVSDVNIQGPGADLLTIRRDTGGNYRILTIGEGATVEVSGLTVTGGAVANGGGIHNAGSLTLEDCAVSKNNGSKGGGIHNHGTLWISNCVISGNIANPSSNYNSSGGGIYNEVDGVLFVQRSIVRANNTFPGFSIHGSGAGIANLGFAAIVGSTISSNMANPRNKSTIGGFGGGIFNRGELLVDSSLITNNLAAGDWWGIGGGICNGSPFSTGGPGGAITINNSTITGNDAYTTGYDNDREPDGGGINSRFGGTVIVSHSTIAGNKASSGIGGFPGHGGGISADPTTTLRMHHVILAGNTSAGEPDFAGALTQSGYNLVGNSTGGSGYAPTDILNVNPLLGPLQDNGGPTFTRALLPGSPAIDAGDPVIEDAPEFDQRGPGFPRIVNGTIDIGAFEVQSTGAPTQPHFLAFLITADFGEIE